MNFKTCEGLTAAELEAAMDAAKLDVFGAGQAKKVANRRALPLSPLMERIVDVMRDEIAPVTAEEIGDEIKASVAMVRNTIHKQRGKLRDHGLELVSFGGQGGGYQLRNLA